MCARDKKGSPPEQFVFHHLPANSPFKFDHLVDVFSNLACILLS